jgi:hypothetical protein
MPKPSLLIALSIVFLASPSGGCKFYVPCDSCDESPTDAGPQPDTLDMDSDAATADGAVVVDAAPEADAAVEQCGQVGGVCTASPNAICPPGTCPYGDDESLDCAGHCCVPDEISSCNSNPDTNCTMTSECTGCWAPATETALICYDGRPCCEWTCGG